MLPKSSGLVVKKYTLKDCVALFNTAKESIKIIIPDTNTDFFWNNQVADALKEAAGRGVSVEIAHNELVKGVGLLSVPGVKTFRLKQHQEKMLITIDVKAVIVERPPSGLRKINVGIICTDAGMLAHEIDAIFDESVETQK